MVYERKSNIQYKADDTLLTNIQSIIENEYLVLQNGIYRLRTGVDPKYQKCKLNVIYDSNETLNFTINNDPHAIWAEQLVTVFCNWFKEKEESS